MAASTVPGFLESSIASPRNRSNDAGFDSDYL